MNLLLKLWNQPNWVKWIIYFAFAYILFAIKEAFVTGTFAGIIPVSKIENRNLQSTNPDSMVNKIRLLYNEHIQHSISSK